MISIITAIKNRTNVLYNGNNKTIYKNSLKSIMDSYNYCKVKSNIELVLVDFNSSDTDYDWVKTYKKLEFRLVKIVDAMNPGRGRNIGVKLAKGDILMFLDADMLFPLDFFKIALTHIQNNCIYFPISFEETKHKWQFFADGNSVLTRQQFLKIGYFKENNTWGKEDNDFHSRAENLFTVRHEILLNFIHQSHDLSWDKKTLKWKN